MTIPAVLCVDVEPDLRRPTVPSGASWAGFERLVADIDRLRKRLAEPSGRPAQIGWFLRMDPQVEVVHGSVEWVATRYADELEAVTGAGDELGLHPHSWRWDGAGWCSDQSADWVAHCAHAALDGYERAFGEPCRSYRHGDRFTSPALVTLLQERGVRCDLGLEPGRPRLDGLDPAEASVGALPAIPDDWVQPFAAGSQGAPGGDDDLLLLPLTSTFDPAPEAPGARFGTLLLWSPPRTFATLFDARLAAGDVRHLAFALRTDVTLDGGSLAWVEQNLDHVGSVLGADLEWVTPTEARRRLLPEVRRALRRDAVWPHSLAVEDLRTVTQRAVAELQEAELASIEAHRHADVVTAERDGALERLRQAEVERDEAQAVARARGEQLTTLEATATWRLHQRLLPVLRTVRGTSRDRHSHRVELRGVIASSGFASGHRVVVGHWAAGPLGPMTDVMWADPDGRRTLVAPSDAVADLITSVYAFDEVEVTDVEVVAGDRRLVVRTDRRELELVAGRGLRLPVPRPAWVTRYVEAPIASALLGVRTYGTSPSGVREWYRADGYRRLAFARAALDGLDLGAMAVVDPPCGFGFSEPPRRPSWVEVRPLLEGPLVLPEAMGPVGFRPRGG